MVAIPLLSSGRLELDSVRRRFDAALDLDVLIAVSNDVSARFKSREEESGRRTRGVLALTQAEKTSS